MSEPSLDAVLSQARRLQRGLTDRLAVQTHQVAGHTERQAELSRLQSEDKATVERYTQAIMVLNHVVEVSSATNLRKLEKLVNLALQRVFGDQDLLFRVIGEVKRGMTVYRFEVLHDGVECKLSSLGGSVWAVIAMTMRFMFSKFAKRYSLQVLDEQLKFVSDEYVDRVVAFITELGQEFGVKFVLVTHDPAFARAARRNYHAVSVGKNTASFHESVPDGGFGSGRLYQGHGSISPTPG